MLVRTIDGKEMEVNENNMNGLIFLDVISDEIVTLVPSTFSTKLLSLIMFKKYVRVRYYSDNKNIPLSNIRLTKIKDITSNDKYMDDLLANGMVENLFKM